MNLTVVGLFSLVIVAGLCMAINNIIFRVAESKGGKPSELLFIATAIVTGFYAVKLNVDILHVVPWYVVVLGIIAGLSQYLMVFLFYQAIKRGPLAPVSCAVSLTFLPAVVYAIVMFGEILTIARGCGILAGVMAVIFASFEQKTESSYTGTHNWLAKCQYLGLLTAIMLGGSLLLVFIKYLSAHPWNSEMSVIDMFENLFYICMNGTICLFCFFDLFIFKRNRISWRLALSSGFFLGISSICFLLLITFCSGRLPAVTVFPVTYLCSLITCTVVSVLVFKERFSFILLGMLLCGISAIVLLN